MSPSAGSGPEAPPRAADCAGDRLDRLLLPNHTAPERLLHLEELLAFAAQHLVDRNARPAGHHRGNVLGRHFLAEHGGLARGLDVRQLLFELRDAAVGKLARLCEIAGALCLLQFKPRRGRAPP
jgi:hypothetical protein